MAVRGLYELSAEDKERASLEYVLREQKRQKGEGDTNRLPVEEALKRGGVYKIKSDRDETRVLFISRDETLLNPERQSLDGFIDLSDLFDEVHILILREGIDARYPVLRVAQNVWLYTASSWRWWEVPVVGLRLISDQLVFADGFRPDLIVARDPFESAVVAIITGRRWRRPVQLHVLSDHERSGFGRDDPHHRWRRFLPRFTIPRFRSVRTATAALERKLAARFSLPDVKTLPRFTNYESLINVSPTLDLRDKYKPFAFIILYIGALSHRSTLYRVIDAARFVLRNPKVGLVVVGDGPAAKECKRRVAILGLERQVVFEKRVDDIVAYLKSANVLVVSDTDADADDVALKGAGAGIPLILARNEVRDDLFVDDTSALLFSPEDVLGCSNKLRLILNDLNLRRRLTEGAQTLVRERFHEDPQAYLRAYRQSIEDVLFLDEDASPASTVDGAV
jgi:glycosyltransferase involved in cell wall biosynthesis